MKRATIKKRNHRSGFAIEITETTELGLAMLIAEAEDGRYEPVAVVANVGEAREVAAGDLAGRMRLLERGDDPGLCPYVYTRTEVRVREEVGTARRGRLPTVVRAAFAAIVYFAGFLTGAPRSLAADDAVPPKTAAGRCAAAYFEAFNSGNNEVMRAFIEMHHALSYLKSRPIEERLAAYQRLHGTFGRLIPLRVALSLELQLTLLVDATKTGNALVMRFQLEPGPPHRLAYLTLSGIDTPAVPDQYVVRVANRAAPVDDALRRSTVHSVADVLRSTYIYPKLGGQMADSLVRKQEEGRYGGAARAGGLADLLTEDARAISNDKHIWVEAQNPMAQESTDPVNLSVGKLRQANYHFRKAEVLPGNIGYIKFDMIHDDQEALEITAAALAFVARCGALIFDIRDNIGGEWATANLILGYLLPKGTVYGYMYDRDGRRVEKRSTPAAIPGRPFDAGVPVYVLTSSRTGSAAEGFAYTLKHLDRATIVGEVTLGMAHPSKEVVVNDYFRVSVPFLRSENVVTGTSFEGSGVVPQIKVAAERALEAAVEDALRRIGNRPL